MSTALTTRHTLPPSDPITGSFAGAFALHVAIAALIIGWAYITHSGKNWGDNSAAAGTIPATMVDALPLPPKQPTDASNVLATETPSPAPITPTPPTVAAPRPDSIPIPVVTPTKPLKTAEKNVPPPPLHPQPTKVDPTKVQTGEAPAMNIPMGAQTQAGTFTVNVTDSAFGTRFAFYIQQIDRKLASQWNVGMLDGRAPGRRVFITFQIARDGSPSHIRIETPSGDATLDQTALSAVQHIDTFGPLPDAYQGTYVNAQYYFEAPPHP